MKKMKKIMKCQKCGSQRMRAIMKNKDADWVEIECAKCSYTVWYNGA